MRTFEVVWPCVLFFTGVFAPQVAMAEAFDVWIASASTESDGPGIYYAELDSEAGTLSTPVRVSAAQPYGFLTLHPALPVLYAAGDFEGEPCVVVYRIERHDGHTTLQLIGAQPTDAGGTTHVSVDRTGRVLLSAHYGSGKVVAFPLRKNGAIEPSSSSHQHTEAAGVHSRQNKACPHWSGVTPDNAYALIPDLGADKVFVYRLDTERATLTPHGAGSVPPGGGPRHLAFHPNGKWAYVVNEMGMALTLFDYKDGVLEQRDTFVSLDEEQLRTRANKASEVAVHPSGRFVYIANRGYDSITAFAIDPTAGDLSLIERKLIPGRWPRHFGLTPDGKWLLAGGRTSNTVELFRIHDEEGSLQPASQTISVPAPVCVVTQARE